MRVPWQSSSPLVRKLPLLVVGLALAGAMIWDTTFLDPVESAGHQPEQFDAEAYAAETFPELAQEIVAQATDLTVLVPAVREDLAAAGAEYGNNLGAGQYAFAVRVTGTVSEVDEDFVMLDVDGLPGESEVRIPMGMALSGIPIRDATGTIGFGDFPDQTSFQSVANAFQAIMRTEVLEPADPPSLVGQTVTVVGAWASGGPADLYLIQPVTIDAAP